MRKNRRSSFLVPLIVVVVIVGLLSISRGVLKTSYKPSSPEIERLALSTTMTPQAQQLFYGQDPKIQPKETFRTLCHKSGHASESTILLGCFTSNGYSGNIVLQSVSDPRLKGTMEVVAAHEMLHAAFQEITPFERSRLDSKLKQAAKRVKDPGLRSVLKTYEQGNPDLYLNELHSYLGTELEDLGNPDLEKHYQRYFRDRQTVIAFAKSSRRELTQLEAQAAQLKAEIDSIEITLKSEEQNIQSFANDLELRVNTLNTMKSNLQSLKQEAEASLIQGNTSLVSNYQQQQDWFNEQVRDYNAQVETHRDRIAQHNQQFETYQQKINAYNQLTQAQRSILSSLKPTPDPVKVPQL